MKTNLKKIARQNRDYYLSEQKADNGENPWFRYVKTMDSYSEVVLLTPAMAQELLNTDKDYMLRKPTPKSVLNKIAEDLKAGTVQMTVAISFSGKLLDGTRILQAVLIGNRPAVANFTFNISDKLGLLF